MYKCSKCIDACPHGALDYYFYTPAVRARPWFVALSVSVSVMLLAGFAFTIVTYLLTGTIPSGGMWKRVPDAIIAEAVLEGVLLGLSSGLFCLASCAPALVPFMMGEDRRLCMGRQGPLPAFPQGGLQHICS